MSDSKFVGFIEPELIQSIIEGKCVLFVGAGISSNIKRSNGRNLPNWKGLLLELLNFGIKNEAKFFGNTSEIRDMIEKKNNYIQAAQELQEVIGLSDIAKYLRNLFYDKNVRPDDRHILINSIPFSAILTTNYVY